MSVLTLGAISYVSRDIGLGMGRNREVEMETMGMQRQLVERCYDECLLLMARQLG
jgi:hypothetical protein